jgi:lipid-A-disaccharide synthase
MPKPLTVFFSVGEPSGDLHGANLIRELRRQAPNLVAVGYGGPKMAAAGCQLHADLTTLAVMWLARVLVNLHKFWDLASRADRFFRHHKPDAVVLIDYPGFNWWIARRAKVHGIPVYYYTPPQIWAWAQWRAAKMRRLCDLALCSLPFEEAWLRQRGCNATFVGHPFFDEVRRLPLDESFIAQQRSRPGPLVAILPGSRTQEVSHNLQWFLKAAAIVRQAVPEARFAVAAFKESQARMAREEIRQAAWESPILGEHTLGQSPIEVYVGKTPELMHAANCCMACSGSVSLELLYHATPTVILYWVSRPAFFVQSLFRKVKYITLVNLLEADARGENIFLKDDAAQSAPESDPSSLLFPEYLTCEDRSAAIAGHVIEWLTDAEKRQSRVAKLESLRDTVGHPGAAAKAAELILEGLGIRD